MCEDTFVSPRLDKSDHGRVVVDRTWSRSSPGHSVIRQEESTRNTRSITPTTTPTRPNHTGTPTLNPRTRVSLLISPHCPHHTTDRMPLRCLCTYRCTDGRGGGGAADVRRARGRTGRRVPLRDVRTRRPRVWERASRCAVSRRRTQSHSRRSRRRSRSGSPRTFSSTSCGRPHHVPASSASR